MLGIQGSFRTEYEDEIGFYTWGHSGCADNDVCSLNTTIVEVPIERHKITAGFMRDRRRAHWYR